MKNYVMLKSDGGITIPAALRRSMHLNYGDRFLIESTPGEGLTLTKVTETCAYCGKQASSNRELQNVKGKLICKKCSKELFSQLKKVVAKED